MSVQTSYLSPQSQWLDLTGKVLILRQNSGAIAITTGSGFGWGPTTDGYGSGKAQHGGVGTGYSDYILLPREDYDLIYQYIYFDAGITFFEDFLKTAEFLFSQDLDKDGEIPDTTVDRAFHYAFHGATLHQSGALTIEFSQAPSNLQLVFERLDQHGERVGGIAPSIDTSFFVDGKTTKIDSGFFKGSYDGINHVLNLSFDWSSFYGTGYKNIIGAGSVMVSIATGTDSLSDGAVFATALYGTNAIDEIYGSSQDEEIFALSGDDYVESGLGDDIIDGGLGLDHLDGGQGDDHLIGGAGADTMIGGIGNDTFTIDDAGDVVIENENEGIDTIESFITKSLSQTYIENITLLGNGAVNATGNAEVNILTGNAAANTLDGAGGADSLNGGAGNDTYIVYGDGEMIEDAAGTDLVKSYTNWTLAADLENLLLLGSDKINATGNSSANFLNGNGADNVLSGGDGVDTLVGGAGNDTLDGGAGADRLSGGLGDDTYLVDNLRDTVSERPGQGIDTILTTLSSLSLSRLTAVEHLTYTGTGSAVLIGNTLSNVLRGSSGNDLLNGGSGADVLVGGTGDDVYVVDHVNDSVTEAAGEGTDTVQSSVSFRLANHVENLTLTGRSAINGTGNDDGNRMLGNTAKNTLDGGLGDDTLDGGTGNDVLLGGDGDDQLIGGNGVDVLTGGNGADHFLFDKLLGRTNIDTITDFESGIDKILLDDAVFKKLIGDTDFSDNFFVRTIVGPAPAQDQNDFIVFDLESSKLYYDADGSGQRAPPVWFATLTGVTDLSHNDFWIV